MTIEQLYEYVTEKLEPLGFDQLSVKHTARKSPGESMRWYYSIWVGRTKGNRRCFFGGLTIDKARADLDRWLASPAATTTCPIAAVPMSSIEFGMIDETVMRVQSEEIPNRLLADLARAS